MATKTESAGFLASAVVTAGPAASPDSVMSNGDNAIYFEVIKTGTATVDIQQRLVSSGPTTFNTAVGVKADGTVGALSNVAAGIVKVTEPTGEYRGMITVSSGNVTINYQKVRALSS